MVLELGLCTGFRVLGLGCFPSKAAYVHPVRLKTQVSKRGVFYFILGRAERDLSGVMKPFTSIIMNENRNMDENIYSSKIICIHLKWWYHPIFW